MCEQRDGSAGSGRAATCVTIHRPGCTLQDATCNRGSIADAGLDALASGELQPGKDGMLTAAIHLFDMIEISLVMVY